MTKKFKFIFYFFCFLFSQFVHGQIFQFENQPIAQVDIAIHANADTTYDSNAVRARMQTKEGGIFSQAEFDEDLKTLAQDFDRIEPKVAMKDEGVCVTLELWAKPTIRSIRWHGNKKIDTYTLQKELGIACFSAFDRQAFNQAFHKLKPYYTQQGFFEACLDYHVELDPEANEVDILIEVKEGRAGKIQEIVFVNFEDNEKHEVLQQMITQKYNIFTSWMDQRGIYNEEAMQQDELAIIHYLQNQGYADAQVNICVQESSKSDRILVMITANKGERYFFGDICFEGNEILSSDLIDSLFTIRPGDPYSIEDARETVEALTDAYGKIGYIDALVDFEPQLVEGQYKYNMRFTIEEGDEYRVGMIRVFGNICTQTPVILHETLLIPGEVFNSVKLKRTEQRLRNIGYFKNVNVYVVKTSDSCPIPGNYRDVYIEVEETNTGQFSASLGYSSVEEIFGALTVTERNFNYKGFSRLFCDGFGALRGGGEYAYISAQIGQKSRTYTASWTKPYFMDTKWTVGADIFNTTTRYISKEYDLETIGMNLRAQYNVNQFMRFGVHYRLKNGFVDLHLDDSSGSCDYSFLEGERQLRRESRIHGLISATGVSLTYDSTNHPVKPTQGFRSKLFIEYAGIGGDHTFLNLGYLNSYYLPVGSRSVLKYRADFRFIQPLGDTRYETLPLDERIFLGGDFLVRGYRPYRLGPQYEGMHTPRGGLSMQLFSFEFNRRMIENVYAFAFFDAGHLSRGTWEFGRFSVAVGYGVRFKLIESIPELTLGMGYPLNPQNRSEVKKFFISIGGAF